MINRFLDNVLAEFEVFVQSGQDLCKLRDTHFDAGRIPDYSDINIQQLYLLRYVYAYAFEYKYMYKLNPLKLPQLAAEVWWITGHFPVSLETPVPLTIGVLIQLNGFISFLLDLGTRWVIIVKTQLTF